jgi:hypothetical protein
MYIRSITSITMETKLAVMIGDDVRIPQAPPHVRSCVRSSVAPAPLCPGTAGSLVGSLVFWYSDSLGSPW